MKDLKLISCLLLVMFNAGVLLPFLCFSVCLLESLDVVAV
jgi:hypothetical protein